MVGGDLDELWQQLKGLVSNELPSLVRKLTGDKVSGKMGAVARLFMMTSRPRAALYESCKTVLLRQMRVTLGATPAISANQIAVMELREFLIARLSAIVRRDLLQMNKGSPGRSKLGGKTLYELWGMTRNMSTAIALGKLSSNGVELSRDSAAKDASCPR